MNGRQKGNRAELQVAALLEGWWERCEPGCKFVRVPSSGGWGTPLLRSEFRVSGDVATTAKKFPWVVEVKHRESWSWERLLAGKPSPVWGWWAQARRQASEMSLAPMLWFRRNREGWSVMSDSLAPHRMPATYGGILDPRSGRRVSISRGEMVLGLDPSSFVPPTAY